MYVCLTVAKRKAYFKELKLGEYNKENIKKLQKKYLRPKDVDGIYGQDTDRLLRHIYNVKKYTKNFAPEDFKCECVGMCTGYPTYMRKSALVILQALRDKTKVPTTVTSGMRCKKYNDSLEGSDPNSYHIKGKAVDLCSTATNTLAKRVDLIKWLNKQGIKFAYCNGYTSTGNKRSAPYMGNAIHLEVK